MGGQRDRQKIRLILNPRYLLLFAFFLGIYFYLLIWLRPSVQEPALLKAAEMFTPPVLRDRLLMSPQNVTAEDQSIREKSITPVMTSLQQKESSSSQMHSESKETGQSFIAERVTVPHEVSFDSLQTPTQFTASKDFVPSANDYAKLMDLSDFHLLIEQPQCSRYVEALIVIQSGLTNWEHRQRVRETWGSFGTKGPNSTLRLIFQVAATYDTEIQDKILEENALYEDIVQGSFVDAYHNMTYKHVMAFKWFLYNCPHAQILIKLDDDVSLNTPLLLRYMHQGKESKAAVSTSFQASRQLFAHPRNLIFCSIMRNVSVSRDPQFKWHLTSEEYEPDYFPDYCPGYFIIYSADIVGRLYVAVQQMPFFWIDDVYMTGIVRERIGAELSNSYPYMRYGDLQENFIYTYPSVNNETYRAIWDDSLTMENTRIIGNTSGVD